MRAARPLDQRRVGGDGRPQGMRLVRSSHGVYRCGGDLGIHIEQGGGVSGSLAGVDAGVRQARVRQEPFDQVEILVVGSGLDRGPEVPVDRLDVLAQLRPTGEAVASGDGKLHARERVGAASWVVLGQEGERLGVTPSGTALEPTALVPQVLEARPAGSWRTSITTPLVIACVRISGPRRVKIGLARFSGGLCPLRGPVAPCAGIERTADGSPRASAVMSVPEALKMPYDEYGWLGAHRTFIGWNPDLTGQADATAAFVGKGGFMYPDDGKRYAYGEFPTKAPKFFDTRTRYDRVDLKSSRTTRRYRW